MRVKLGIVPAHGYNKLLYGLAYSVAIIRTRGRHRLEAMVLDGINDFLLPKIHQRTYYSNIHLVQVGLWRKGMNLAGIKQAHKKSFHCIIVMMSIGYLVTAMLLGKTVHGTPAEKGTGIAWVLSILSFNGTCNIHVNCIEGDFQLLHKCSDAFHTFTKILGKHGIYGNSL